MARRNGSGTGVLVYRILARYSLSRGLKLVVLVASKVVACMQPDSIRPAASNPSFILSDDTLNDDDMAYFQSKTLAFPGERLRPKRDDSVNRIIDDIGPNSRA